MLLGPVRGKISPIMLRTLEGLLRKPPGRNHLFPLQMRFQATSFRSVRTLSAFPRSRPNIPVPAIRPLWTPRRLLYTETQLETKKPSAFKRFAVRLYYSALFTLVLLTFVIVVATSPVMLLAKKLISEGSIQLDKQLGSDGSVPLGPSKYRNQEIKEGTTVFWKFQKLVAPEVLSQKENVFAQFFGQKSISYLDLLLTLSSIAEDDRITSLVVDFSSTGQRSASYGYAQIQELRQAILRLKRTKADRGVGNFSAIAITDTFESQLHYYLATVFDKIQMEPLGAIPLVGASSVAPFFKNILNRLHINITPYAVGKYKSVVSSASESAWPEAQKTNLRDVLRSLTNDLVNGICEMGVQKEILELLMESPSITASEALENKLITDIGYRFQYQPAPNSAGTPTITMEKYASRPLVRVMAPKSAIGVVTLSGTISRGDGPGGSQTITSALFSAAADPSVDAILLRIDSGGGDVVASDTIREAVQQILKQGKQVIASYGNICASGGVFVSSGCSTILASPGTITGSIGVATIRPHITPEALDLVGVTTDEVVLTEGAKDSHFTNSLSEKGWKRHRSIVDDMYVRFKSIVSEGRRMSTEQVEDIAQGQIWSGSKAVEIGLVDHIGGYQEALKVARIAANVHAKERGSTSFVPEIKVFPRPLTWFEKIAKVAQGDSFVMREAVSTFVTALGEEVEYSMKDENVYRLEDNIRFD